MYKMVGSLINTNKDILRDINNVFSIDREFTFKDLRTTITNYTLKLHRRLIINEILLKSTKDKYQEYWSFKLNPEIVEYL